MGRMSLQQLMIILPVFLLIAKLVDFMHEAGQSNPKKDKAPLIRAPEAKLKKEKPANRVNFKKTPEVDKALPRLLQEQARLLTMTTENPEQIAADTRAVAQAMTVAELKELQNVAINENANKDERLAAVYLLMSAESKGQQSLMEVVFAPSSAMDAEAKAHSLAEANKNFELNIRVMALQAIEKNSLAAGEADLQSRRTGNAYLNSLMDIVEQSQKVGQPLLQRFIDESLTGVRI